MKTAVVVVDMINDFVTGVFKSERAEKIVPNVKLLLDSARKQRMPIIYASDAHVPDADKEFRVWPPHAVAGTWGAQIVDELKPAKGDYTIQKRVYSAFQKTDLDRILRELKVDTLIIVGLVTDICVQHTAADAFFRGYRIIIPQDCVEASSAEVQKTAIDYMKKVYGSEITNLKEIMKRKWS